MMNSKTTVALLFAMVSLGGMIAIPGLSLVPTTTAYAQTSLAEDIVGGVLDDIFGDDEEQEDNRAEDEEAADNSQTVEQPVTQDVNQDVDQSEENDQSNTNTQTQTGVIDQDTEQGIQDDDDSAESESESGDAKADKKYGTASSSSSSGDAASINNQDAANDASLQQVQVQNVDQNNFAEFGDDTADLDAVSLALPIAVPINVQLEEEEEVEEVPPVEEQPPDEEDTIRICTPEGERFVTFEELLELIEEGEDFSIPPENAVCVIVVPLP
jgi:hypothetical protein